MNKNTIPEFLNYLPYRFSYYDKDNHLAYSNHASDGSFFPTDDPDSLPDWIWEKVLTAKSHILHLDITNDSFENILIQSYQAIFDQESEFQGIVTYIQNIQPLLASYLESSGQALVGWSDTTSGASISSDKLDSGQ